MASERSMTIKFLGDTKNLSRGLKDVVSGLDDTESAGKRVAAAIDIMTGKSVDKHRQHQAAVDQLSSALGTETVSAIERAGGSVSEWINELQRAGLAYDELGADIDAVADSIRRAESANGTFDQLGTKAETASGKVDKLRDSGDQSGSVLANMVGNSVQDLGALGGVAGTAGMALGQMAEYATEGNINLSGLAKIAGPMIGVTAAVVGVTWAVGKLREGSEKAEEAGKGMLEVQKQLRDGRFGEAATNLQEDWKGTIATLTEMGFTTEQVIAHMTGQKSITEELDRVTAAHRVTLEGDTMALSKYNGDMQVLRDNLGLATTAFKDQGVELDETTTQTNAIEGALRTLIGTSEDTAGAFGTVDRSAEDYRDEVRRAEQATRDLDEAYRMLTGKLDAKGAWLGLQDSMRQYRWDMAAGELSTDEKRQALVDLQGELVTYLGSLEGIPIEKQTEILAMIDAGQIEEAERQLTHLSRTRATTVNVNVIDPGGRYIAGGSNVVGATGGIVTRPTRALIGEAGPEAVIPLDSLPGNYPLSGSMNLGGGQTINLTVQVPPTVDLATVGGQVAEALLAHARTSGPVFQTVRG